MTARGTIVLLTGSHLCNNPRTVKEADALSAAGFDVEVLGWIADREHQAEDREMLSSRRWRFTPCVDLLQGSPPARLRAFGSRAERRLAFALAGATGWQTAAQLGGWRREFLGAARRRNADLFIAHSAMTIWAAVQLLREGRRVGVDMEDWFSNEHPAPYPSSLVALHEAELLRGGSHATCTSDAMGQALAEAYRCTPPKTVYNVFPWSERERLDGQLKDRRDRRCPSLHWYSQTLGAGRGLEDLFAALPYVTGNLEIHLRGTLASQAQAWLDREIPAAWRDRVHVHGPVANAALLSRISEHDIGFAGEMKSPPSRDLTVTNKILQYLLAGLAAVASDTQGQSEVARSAPGAVFLYRSGDPRSLAGQIDALLAAPEMLQSAKRAALEAARERFCWEKSAPRLVDSVAAALATGSR